MEWITILLSGLLAGITPVGVILDTVVENQIRSRLPSDTLEVRIDNTPTHQVLQGKIDQVRLASRGVYLTPELRVAVLELETDPVHVDLDAIQNGVEDFRTVFRQPLNAGVRLQMTEADLNQMLASEEWQQRLQAIAQGIATNIPGRAEQSYELTTLTFDFLDDNRLQLQAQLRALDGEGKVSEELDLQLETGLGLETGAKIALENPQIWLDGEELPNFIMGVVEENLRDRLTLNALDHTGITVRLLQLEIDDQALNLAAFVHLPAQD
ncbi:DUF2993 domain-containing protein [Spirulina sp. CS-785/01]|uniref:LmeA family phospholipid-binding protein n=1 Tax=Spirulina sp. CS-785/01 TaxID=3021716 RepID=UPI00232FE1EB|nr:DUF2993 domain-containing protein [Spirulina sp. CS-785/01]MDB9314702.1 DUF2993 domain-containing protein [Spirulina sp. CS-785/01]